MMRFSIGMITALAFTVNKSNAFTQSPKTFAPLVVTTNGREYVKKHYGSPCELRSTSSDIDPILTPSKNDIKAAVDTTEDVEETTKTEAIKTTTKEEFVNDGLFAWMKPYLDLFGFVEGNTVYYGPGVAVDSSTFPSIQEQERLRKEAEENMMNIGVDERERRRQAGEIAYKLVVVYAILSSVFLDDGSIGGHFARFAIALPLFFANGYIKSAETGLCNLAQAGRWDVDGTGIRDIEDPDLARAFIVKVNQMNLDNARDSILLAGIFAALPQEITSKVSIIALLLGGLYVLNGKLPKNA